MGPPPRVEWEPFNEEEMAILLRLKQHYGAEKFKTIPRDLVICFIRGYSTEKDWFASTQEYLDKALAWRVEMGADTIHESPPDKRAEFERLWPGGPVGVDEEGHPVFLEQIGKIPAKEFVNTFPEELFLRNCVYNKEAMRKYGWMMSGKKEKRLYKIVSVLDLGGVGASHTSKAFYGLIQKYIGTFSWYYPETLFQLYIINAPWIFSGAWALIKPWLDPITAKKINIVGGNYDKVFAANGITLTENIKEGPKLKWSDFVAQTALVDPVCKEPWQDEAISKQFQQVIDTPDEGGTPAAPAAAEEK